MSESWNTRETLLLKMKNQHDDHSWEDFLFFYKNYIYAMIYKMGVSSSEADDLAQKILLALWQKLPTFEYHPEKCKFRTWMTSIINNNCKLYFRTASRYQNKIDKYANEEANDHNPDIEAISEKEWKDHIVKLASETISQNFSDQESECLKLILKATPVETISETLNLKKNTAYVMRQRILEKLNRKVRYLNEELG